MRDIKIASLFTIILIFILNLDVHSIDFKVESTLSPPTVPEELSTANLGFPTIHWAGQKLLIYTMNPFFRGYDIESEEYIKLDRIYGILKGDNLYARVHDIKHSDDVIISYGSAFDRQAFYFALDRELYHFKDRKFQELIYNPAWKNNNMSEMPIASDWEYKLFGENYLVPRPIYGPDTASVSLRTSDGSIQNIFPVFDARNLPNYSMTALRSDKFKLAIFIAVVQETENSSMKIDPRIYLFSITYAGSFAESAQLHEKPDFSSSIITSLPANYEVEVSASQNFIQGGNGREDYWYFVSDGEIEGWVFGGNLLIEGENWEDRLASRGRPFDLEDFLAEQNDNQAANAEEENPVTDDEEKVERSSFSSKRNSETFHRILIIGVLIAITLTIVISFVGSKMKKATGHTSDS